MLRNIGSLVMMPVDCVYTAQWSTPIVSYPYGAMNFMPALGIRILIAHSCTRCRWILKRLSQDGEQVDFSKNLRAILSLKNTFQINLISAGSSGTVPLIA
jgi:hypothetical protein